jgi:bacteriocin-like protein
MKNSIQNLKTLLVAAEKLTIEQLNNIIGGCGSPNDPKRCKSSTN